MKSIVILVFTLLPMIGWGGYPGHPDISHLKLEEQWGDPQKKNRICACMFGYDIPFSNMLKLPLGQPLDPNDFGNHSYSSGFSSEKNGITYTCRGGFVDTTHFRAGMDWTVHMILLFEKLYESGETIDVRPEGGPVKFRFIKQNNPLSFEDRIRLAIRISYERLAWHELMSWYYHAPAHMFPEDQSALSPEDNYSNLLGAHLGAHAFKLMLKNPQLTYSQAADQAIDTMMNKLEKVGTIEDVKLAFDQVDRNKQMSLPYGERDRLWYDSSIPLLDQRFVYKRDTRYFTSTSLKPWLVSDPQALRCSAPVQPERLEIPTWTMDGKSKLENYYEFVLHPERKLFKGDRHKALPKIVRSKDLPQVLKQIEKEMERDLGVGVSNPYRQYNEGKEIVTKTQKENASLSVLVPRIFNELKTIKLNDTSCEELYLSSLQIFNIPLTQIGIRDLNISLSLLSRGSLFRETIVERSADAKSSICKKALAALERANRYIEDVTLYQIYRDKGLTPSLVSKDLVSFQGHNLQRGDILLVQKDDKDSLVKRIYSEIGSDFESMGTVVLNGRGEKRIHTSKDSQTVDEFLKNKLRVIHLRPRDGETFLPPLAASIRNQAYDKFFQKMKEKKTSKFLPESYLLDSRFLFIGEWRKISEIPRMHISEAASHFIASKVSQEELGLNYPLGSVNYQFKASVKLMSNYLDEHYEEAWKVTRTGLSKALMTTILENLLESKNQRREIILKYLDR